MEGCRRHSRVRGAAGRDFTTPQLREPGRSDLNVLRGHPPISSEDASVLCSESLHKYTSASSP